MGLEFTEHASGDSTALVFQLNGRVVTLLTHERGFQLSACIGDQVAPLKENQWNREHFSTRAFRDEQGCDSLEADVKFGGLATKEMVEELIREYLTDVTIYARFVTELPPGSDTASAAPAAGPADRLKSPIGPMEWTQLGQNTKRVPPSPQAAVSASGLLKINRYISLRYDPDRWRPAAPENKGQLALLHSSGEAHALVIAERIAVSRGSVEDVALANAQSADPRAKIVYRQQRRINGADVRFVKIEAEVNEVPMVYWGYFYGGEYGTVQVVTYTEKDLLPKYEKEFLELLEGFTIPK